jgi:hypothetical protein
MENPKSPYELEQENLALRNSLRLEKLKKAEELLAHRLVYSAVIGVILFIILDAAIDDTSNWVQWLCLAVFFGVALFVVARISVHYAREKEEAEK